MLPTQISPNLLGIHYVATAVTVGVGAVPTLYMAGEFSVIGNGAALTRVEKSNWETGQRPGLGGICFAVVASGIRMLVRRLQRLVLRDVTTIEHVPNTELPSN